MKYIGLLLVILVLCSAVEAGKLERILFNSTEYPEAKCLDGTQAGIYYQQGSGSGADKYLFYFEGGGVCLGPTPELVLVACYDRSFTPFGSSKNWAAQRAGVGMMSDDCKLKNIFLLTDSKDLFFFFSLFILPEGVFLIFLSS